MSSPPLLASIPVAMKQRMAPAQSSPAKPLNITFRNLNSTSMKQKVQSKTCTHFSHVGVFLGGVKELGPSLSSRVLASASDKPDSRLVSSCLANISRGIVCSSL